MKAELRKVFGNKCTTAQLGEYNQDYLKRAWNGELRKIGRGVWDLTGNDLFDNEETNKAPLLLEVPREDKANKILKRFTVLSTLADGVVAGNIRALIVAGAAGVGKTFELEKKLNAAVRNGEVDSMVSVKGSVSAIGLYELLWNNKDAGQVLVFDDADAIYGDEEALNLLKGALDSGTKRTITWAKASRFLQDQDIPRSFDYEGQIVFITNLDPERIIEKGGRMAPHMNALLSRSVFLDLCIHDKESILIRVEQVLRTSDMAYTLKINDAQVEQILCWLNENVNRLRSLSIRTVIQLANFVKTSDDWQDLAEVTLLKNS